MEKKSIKPKIIGTKDINESNLFTEKKLERSPAIPKSRSGTSKGVLLILSMPEDTALKATKKIPTAETIPKRACFGIANASVEIVAKRMGRRRRNNPRINTPAFSNDFELFRSSIFYSD